MKLVILVVIGLIDMAITIGVLRFIAGRRSHGGKGLSRPLAGLVAGHELELQEYVEANWDGDPDSLPTLLEALLDRLESHAQVTGITADRAQLKPVVEQLVLSHGTARAADVREAMQRIA